MNVKAMIEQQKKSIMLHRIVYIIFFLLRMYLQYTSRDISMKNTVCILSFLTICAFCDELFYHTNYFNQLFVLRVSRYTECLLSTAMLCFVQEADLTNIAVIAVIIMFVVDYFLTMNIADKESLIAYMLYIGIPVLAVLCIRLSFTGSTQWSFMFFDVLILLLVLFYEAYTFVDYMNRMERAVLDQKNENDDMVKKNEEILHMQESLKNNNEVLNRRKIELQQAYTQIQESNEEMMVQAEILHYIAMSFDVSKISNQIIDSIMQVKKPGFCAVYIKKDVYLNKHANYVIKTDIGQLQSKLRESMDEIYEQMITNGDLEKTYHCNEKSQFPFLKDVNINSLYVKVLGLEDDTYGLFMLGDSRPNLFHDNMSFYDAIIAQYDIAISNAKIYSEMQHMAQKDGLTGINNRIHFIQLFKDTVNKMQQENGCISVALFDIDKFKSVNDTYGHLAGDEVIKRIASVTESCIEKYDGFVCRYGGEEFVVALPNRTIEVAQPIIEELFEELCKQVVHYNEYDIPMSVSVGLTAYPEVCKDPDDLLKRADWCMYYAKEHGRHRINVDDGSIQRE